MKIQEIKRYFKVLEKDENYSGSILISKGNETVMKESYGMANRNLEVPNTLNTKYCIASISKSITSMAVLILADQGKLKLEDTVDHYLPELEHGNEITIYHLITHTSGIYTIDNDPIYKQLKCESHSMDEIFNNFKNRPLEFKPGERFEYSNYGYILLSLIIEKQSGVTYEQFIHNHIFAKLSMNDSGLFRSEQILKGMANGYSKLEEEIINSDLQKLSYYGAGGLYSTVEDIHQFTKALKNGELLSDNFRKRLFIDSVWAEGEFYYGYGFVLYKPNKKNIDYIYQDGSVPGYRSIYMIYPAEDITIIILNNYDYIRVERIMDDLEPLLK